MVADISKPIRSEELFRLIKNHARTADLAVEKAPTQQAPNEMLDAAALLNRMDGDVELLQEIVDVFRGDCPRMLSAIREAVEAVSPKALMRAAHGLKGSLSYFGTTSAFEAA